MTTRKPVLFYVPIEPIESRYSASWYTNFPKAFSRLFDVQTIDGSALTDKIQVGSFLDMNSTVAYKAAQMSTIARLFHDKTVPDGSVFFFADLEYWGIESVRLMAQLNNVRVTLASFLHAASYTIGDAFEVAAPYQKYTEVGWVAAMDLVFVGSEYHRQAVIDRRLAPLKAEGLASKIFATGNPMFADDYESFSVVRNQFQVILPNRFDEEKGAGVSLAIAKKIKQAVPDCRIVVTTSASSLKSNRPELVSEARALAAAGVIEIMEGLSKHEYHEQLAFSNAMLSCSTEENFGYCIAEGLHYGVHPVARNSLSHPELGVNVTSLVSSEHFETAALSTLIRVLNTPSLKRPSLSPRFYCAADTIADHIYAAVSSHFY